MPRRDGQRRRRERAGGDPEAQILPLVNIVFLLLVVFMAVGRLSASDPFAIEPLLSESDGAPGDGPILIAVGAEGQLALDGAAIAEAALIARIARRAPGDEVRLKTDGRAAAADVVRLIERLKAAGVETVRLMTVPARGSAS